MRLPARHPRACLPVTPARLSSSAMPVPFFLQPATTLLSRVATLKHSPSSASRNSVPRPATLAVALALSTLLLLTIPSAPSAPTPASPALQTTSCTCPASPLPRPFLAQPFDPCLLACTPSGAFLSPFPEPSTIAAGRAAMALFTTSICLLARNSEAAVPALARKLFALAAPFAAAHFTIIVNDTDDDLVASLRILARLLPSPHTLHVIALDLAATRKRFTDRPFPPAAIYDSASFSRYRAARYNLMSLLRTHCLRRVAAAARRPDFLILADADAHVDAHPVDVDGIAHTFGLKARRLGPAWDAACSNGVVDKPRAEDGGQVRFAVPVAAAPRAARHWVFRDSLAFRDSRFGRNGWRRHEHVAHSPYEAPFEVQSCFGGLAVYDVARSHFDTQCSYDSYADNDCEHVSFHRCMREHGYKIVMNPRMVVRYAKQ